MSQVSHNVDGRLAILITDERLEEVELPRPEDRKTRGYMILTYRLINGEEIINYTEDFGVCLISQSNPSVVRALPMLRVSLYIWSRGVEHYVTSDEFRLGTGERASNPGGE